MNNLDRYIIEDLSPDIELPQSYHDIISNTLKNKQLRKRYKLKKLIHTIITLISSLFFTSGMVFAGYTVYEKVWKEPIEFSNVHEYLEKDSETQKSKKEEINSLPSASLESIVDLANIIIDNLDYDYVFDKNDINTIAMSPNYYYTINIDNISLDFSQDGTFQNFFDNNFFYNFSLKTEKISEKEAKEYAYSIFNNINIGLNKVYSLNKIEEISFVSNDKECKEWRAVFYQTYDNLTNEYDYIDMNFVIVDNKLLIKDIRTINSDYLYEDNELQISKEKAIEIAQNLDRKISLLEIKNIEAEIAIKDMNSFAFVQEKSLGVEDEIKHEEQEDGRMISYNGYHTEKVLRNVWNVKFKYIINKEKQKNASEYYGRNYYVDITTGEIIGGAWDY